MLEPVKFLILGNGKSAESFANGFIDGGSVCIGAVSIQTHLLPDNSKGLISWANKRAIDYFQIIDANSVELKTIVEKTRAELLLVEWPKILSKETIGIFPRGAIGTHPSFLPWGRGRHPLHWQIVLGYSEIFLSAFQLTPEVDSGPLLLQSPIEVDSNETILTLLEKVNFQTYKFGVELANQLLKTGFLEKIPKNTINGTTWRRRTFEDIEIDCRMSRDSISRLVRSVCPPFIGAKLLTEFGSLTIERALNWEFDSWEFHQIGSIISVNDESVVLRVDDGLIKLFVYGSMPAGMYDCPFVRPPSFYRNRK
jgi:methionyl-tRNA formyltransferase